MKEKIEIMVENACDGCVLDFGDCHANPVLLSQVMEKYGITAADPKNNDFIVQCPERLVPPDDAEEEPAYPPYRRPE